MIARIWHGWTAPADADAYEELLRSTILPGIEGREGYRGAYLLRRIEDEGEVEFVTITTFDSMDAARAFSHDGERGAVVPDEARELLTHFDLRSVHYEMVLQPGDPGRGEG